MEFGNRAPRGAMPSSDRLKKAIERNRAKVAKRNVQVNNYRAQSPVRPRGASVGGADSGLTLSERLNQLKQKRSGIQPSRFNSSTQKTSAGLNPSRRVNPTASSQIDILKARRQNINPVNNNNFSTTGIGEKLAEKNFSFFDKIFSSAIKALLAKTLRLSIWTANIVFLAIVIFGDRGVVDYLSRHRGFLQKNDQLIFLKNENEEIKFQIYRMQNDVSYQRQIIRDYLGYIANDEYLVIFSEK